MTAAQWKDGREGSALTQQHAARVLRISQPYLSQLESGLRIASEGLSRKGAKLYKLPPTALPMRETAEAGPVPPEILQRKIASLGYPGFAHVPFRVVCNPAEVLLGAVANRDLDTRLVEALPWILATYHDLNWPWLRDRAKVRNAQNRLGYLVHLARQSAGNLASVVQTATLSRWEHDLEEARLATEGTLCRDSMPVREREWMRLNRPPVAVHWNLLTALTAVQLPYAR